jgi:post-segregation antitoxin (ccd killing protein)
MFVIRLPNGNLMVPESAMSDSGQLMSDAYVEIGPGDVDYARLAAKAVTEEEAAERRRQWQEGDEPLRREFLDFLARHGHPGRGPGAGDGRGSA